jgi:hypothetical protein
LSLDAKWHQQICLNPQLQAHKICIRMRAGRCVNFADTISRRALAARSKKFFRIPNVEKKT